jgi:CheY-like chemotaxis protein
VAAASFGMRAVVLVVEDEPLVRMLALELVADEGFEAISASNADEAIRILETRSDIQIVFTDINMPGSMDGLKLTYAVRERWPPVQLLVTSALLSNRALPKGSIFLPKPYSPDQLSTALHHLAVFC